MYSGTVKPRDVFLAELEKKVGPIRPGELVVGPDEITCLPCERPWRTADGITLVYLTDVKRRLDGSLVFQLGDEDGKPLLGGTVWRPADSNFADIWPE